jgi:3D (Asp-Asp-Asp) domain-containing protein
MKKILFLLVIGAISGVLLIFALKIQKAGAGPISSDLLLPNTEKLFIVQGNSLSAIYNRSIPEPQIEKKVKMVITAYSSTTWQTDDTPFITASGSGVKDGIVANNLLPFGTEIRIPEIYGDKVFVVEDRMNWKKSDYHLDVWLPEYEQALNFGAKRTYVEILAN